MLSSHMDGASYRRLSDHEAVEEAKSYGDRGTLRTQNEALYKRVLTMGKIDEVFRGDGIIRWNRVNVTAESKKYLNKEQFKRGRKGAYKAARRLGILDELFPVDKSVKG